MTQKELLYVEDAIGHEKTISTVIGETIELLEDEDLQNYMEDELKKHEDIQNDLIELLEDIKDE